MVGFIEMKQKYLNFRCLVGQGEVEEGWKLHHSTVLIFSSTVLLPYLWASFNNRSNLRNYCKTPASICLLQANQSFVTSKRVNKNCTRSLTTASGKLSAESNMDQFMCVFFKVGVRHPSSLFCLQVKIKCLFLTY